MYIIISVLNFCFRGFFSQKRIWSKCPPQTLIWTRSRRPWSSLCGTGVPAENRRGGNATTPCCQRSRISSRTGQYKERYKIGKHTYFSGFSREVLIWYKDLLKPEFCLEMLLVWAWSAMNLLHLLGEKNWFLRMITGVPPQRVIYSYAILQGCLHGECPRPWGRARETRIWVCSRGVQMPRERVEPLHAAGLQLCSKQVRSSYIVILNKTKVHSYIFVLNKQACSYLFFMNK